MKKALLAIAIIITSINAFAQVKKVTNSYITFKIKNLGINTGGKFGTPVAEIKFNPKALGTSSIVASVDAASIDTDNEKKDKHLKGEDYFDVAKYPKITMKSLSFKHGNADNYTGQFNVTIKDKTKVINVPFTYTESATAAFFKGIFKIKRSDFGIGGSSMMLSDEATITVDVETGK